MKTIAILGSHPDISVAELAVITAKEPELRSKTAALFDISTDLPDLQTRLGGTQKLCEVIGQGKRLEDLIPLMQKTLEEIPGDDKLRFGISVYSLGGNATGPITKQREKIGISLKKAARGNGRSVRYVTSRDENLSTVVVTKNKLVSHGAEFVVATTPDRLLLARTRAVQDFEDWSHRDYDRPGRDPRRGMLPPKLARIMVNLTGAETSNLTLLDPFCGSGTVLMEGAMVGFGKLIGSDLSAYAVEDTKHNLEWLAGERVALPELDVHQSAAANVGSFVSDASVDAIVTEPFLGRPRKGSETQQKVQEIVEELEELYLESFPALAKTLKPGGVTVIAFPVHFVDGHAQELPIKEILRTSGLVEDTPSNAILLYRRENQYVGRQLVRCRLDK